MSKSTETTNDRVPRVLVRFGKHHRVYGNTIECMETPSSVWKHPSSVWKHPSSVWKHHRAWGNTRESWGNTHRAWGNVGRTEALLGSTEACGTLGTRGRGAGG